MKRLPSFSLRRSRGIALGSIVVGVFVAIAVACSNQGEGERCNVDNGNDDCKTDEGLICYRAALLRDTRDYAPDRCCPSDPSKATHPLCKSPVSGLGDAAVPPDTGPPTPVADADVDTGTTDDAGADAAADADADAQ
ncbi:MAG TPA: hypothetical protein VM925_12400 [Labilithrix sp.]|nr:hypothetical protein [Labilithrix sp.]